MAWIYVIIAGLLEVAWTVGLKTSEGFTRPGISVLTLAGVILSFILLALGMRTLPMGTVYTIWTGIGVIGSVTFGIIVFGESRDALRLTCVALILIGIVGLKFVAKE